MTDGTALMLFLDRERPAECEAARFYLEHRFGPRKTTADPNPLRIPNPGRSLPAFDIEGTCQAIGKAVETLPESWRGVVVVSLGWGVSVRRLQDEAPSDGGMPFLTRAGFPLVLPFALTNHGLRSKARDFRDALLVMGLVDPTEKRRGDAQDDAPPSARAETQEERVMREGERPVSGWKTVAALVGASEDTAQKWHREQGLPVYQPVPKGRVIAYPSELAAWVADRVRAGEDAA